MLRILLLLFVVMPACELGLMIYFGKMIGLLPTIMLIIATGIGGAYLAKYQGLIVWQKVQRQLARGIMPGDEMVDGISILAGGVLLLAPGFISDLAGLLLLLPPTRALVKPLIRKLFRKKIDRNTITIIQ
ncbi:FxsA family protein [Bacillus testis]|uniref:FxsA family protein n=1 Tax=Bacillus testis TaxID=1622072 RepID=UPI00067EB92C|nr:FxsA family protein [Bacillus testis]